MKIEEYLWLRNNVSELFDNGLLKPEYLHNEPYEGEPYEVSVKQYLTFNYDPIIYQCRYALNKISNYYFLKIMQTPPSEELVELLNKYYILVSKLNFDRFSDYHSCDLSFVLTNIYNLNKFSHRILPGIKIKYGLNDDIVHFILTSEYFIYFDEKFKLIKLN